MAITGASRGTSNGTIWTPASTMPAGTLGVAVYAYANSGGGGADPYSSISDSVGNTWVSRQNVHFDPGAASAGIDLRIFTCAILTDITTSDSITVSGPSGNGAPALWTFSGAAGSTIDYVSGGVSTGANTTTPTVTSTSIASGDCIVGGGGQHGTGWGVISQYKVVTGAGTQTYNPTINSSTSAWTADSDTTNGSWSTAQSVNGSGTNVAAAVAWISLHETAAASGGMLDPMGMSGFFGG